MNVNQFPRYDTSDNPTGCCPRFDPAGWDRQELHLREKLFVKATTRSLMHFPLNMGRVFSRTFTAIDKAGARPAVSAIVLSRDPSPWRGEHLFAVEKAVPGEEMARLSGEFVTKVFEGPYRDMPKWCRETEAYVASLGKHSGTIRYFYTTCPKCARQYGKNYVVAVAATE